MWSNVTFSLFYYFRNCCLSQLKVFKFHFNISGAGSDNNQAHPDTSMKLGRNVH